MTDRLPLIVITSLVLVGLLVPATAQARPPGGIAGVMATATAEPALPGCLAPTTIQAIPQLRRVGSITVAASDDLWVRGEPAKPGGASILHSDGHTWRDAAQGLPPGSGLTSIAAGGPDAVWGIGSMQAGNPLARVLVARWQGARWQQVAVPAPSTETHNGPAAIAAASDYTNLSVVADDDVWLAAGQGFGLPVVLHWDGRHWATVPGADAFGNVYVRSIVASGPADLWLVGEHEGGSAAALHYDGHGWTDKPLGIPGSGDPAVVRSDGSAVGLESTLLTVDALSPGEVWAAGITMQIGAVDFVDRRGLALRWDGARWVGVPVPYPGTSTDLHDVAIAALHDVWALGGAGLGLLHWDGARWTRVPATWGSPSAVAVVSPERALVGGTRPSIGTGPDQGLIAEYGPIRCAPADPVLARTALPAGSTAAALDPIRQHLFALGTAATMVDAASGRILATAPLSGTAMAAVAAPQAGRVFVLSDTCTQSPTYPCATRLSSLDAGSGALAGTTGLPDQPVALALGPRNGRVYALTAPDSGAGGVGTLSAYDGASGTLTFTRTVGLNPRALAADERTGLLFVVDAGPGSWVTNGELFFAPDGNADVRTIDPATGNTLRVMPLAAHAWGMPTIAGTAGRVYVRLGELPPAEPWIVTIDAASGALVSQRQVPSLDRAGLAPQIRALLDPLVAYDPRDGLLIEATQVHYDHYGMPNGGGLASLTDALSGTSVLTTTVGAVPLGTFWDAALGRALIVTAGDGTGDDAQNINQSGYYRELYAHGSVVALDPDPARTVPLLSGTPADPVSPDANSGGRYFAASHHRMFDPFLAYWHAHGDLATLGYPLTEPFIEDGHPAQYTERFLLEQIDGQIRPVPLGRLLTSLKGFGPVAPASGGPRLYFPSTKQRLAGRFLAFWRTHGAEALLGVPLAAPTLERNGDGSSRIYLVQWCTKARLEYHPEAAGTLYEVQLGLLGRQDMRRRGWLRR